MSMRTLNRDFEVENLLNAAEANSRCAVTHDSLLREKLRRRVSCGELLTPESQLFVRASYWECLDQRDKSLHLIRALSQLHPEWIFSYASAALLHHLDVSFDLLYKVHIMTFAASHCRSTSGVKRHFMHPNLTDEVATIDGIKVTSLQRTVFDCSRYYPFEKSLGIIDSALRTCPLNQTTLLAFCEEKQKFRGVRQAQISISYGNSLSENGGESLARARIISMGFAVPQLQRSFKDHITQQLYRADYVWQREDGSTLIGEYHGMQKYTDPEMTRGKSLKELLSAESKRRSRISVNNTEVLDFDYSDVIRWHHFYDLLCKYQVPRRTLALTGHPEFYQAKERS
jgi:hypothetical protein